MPTHLTPFNATLPIPYVKLHKTSKLSPDGKAYMCFKINGISSQAVKCFNYRIMNKVIDYILCIDKFEKTMCVAERYVTITLSQISHEDYYD